MEPESILFFRFVWFSLSSFLFIWRPIWCPSINPTVNQTSSMSSENSQLLKHQHGTMFDSTETLKRMNERKLERACQQCCRLFHAKMCQNGSHCEPKTMTKSLLMMFDGSKLFWALFPPFASIVVFNTCCEWKNSPFHWLKMLCKNLCLGHKTTLTTMTSCRQPVFNTLDAMQTSDLTRKWFCQKKWEISPPF